MFDPCFLKFFSVFAKTRGHVGCIALVERPFKGFERIRIVALLVPRLSKIERKLPLHQLFGGPAENRFAAQQGGKRSSARTSVQR